MQYSFLDVTMLTYETPKSSVLKKQVWFSNHCLGWVFGGRAALLAFIQVPRSSNPVFLTVLHCFSTPGMQLAGERAHRRVCGRSSESWKWHTVFLFTFMWPNLIAKEAWKGRLLVCPGTSREWNLADSKQNLPHSQSWWLNSVLFQDCFDFNQDYIQNHFKEI